MNFRKEGKTKPWTAPREGGSIHRFTYPWWRRLFRMTPRHGWRVYCWQCPWVIQQPEHKRGLWRQYQDHLASHGG